MEATTSVYNAIRAELLPTPSKSHYTYNLRDVSKVRALAVSLLSIQDRISVPTQQSTTLINPTKPHPTQFHLDPTQNRTQNRSSRA